MANCKTCQHAILDTIGDGTGIFQCLVYNDYMTKGGAEYALHSARIKLGNAWNSEIFWPGERNCEKYKTKIN